MSDTDLLHTPFHDWHASHDGRMVEFGGWHMPVQYSTIVEEHNAVRTAAGLFDISHMGRLRFSGDDACSLLDYLLTNDVSRLKVGQVRYSLVTNESGGVLDDVLVYRLPDCYMLVVNASNRLKIVNWIGQHISRFNVRFEDQTHSYAMIAVQGPKAAGILSAIGAESASDHRYYSVSEMTVAGMTALVSRTGYTGEDGFELIVPAETGMELWSRLLEVGQPTGLQACGLGCRDTLRLEAAMPLYGHELNEDTDPLSAGLGFAVKLDAADFIGRAALAKIAESQPQRVRVGLELEGKRIAREGATILSGHDVIGEVTSGTFSPTLQKAIAMGYVDVAASKTGSEVEVDIRGKRHPAKVVDLPFYKRAK
ncbi:MAG: glycine cleavage system aminomethyltransferase GcvT [Planctomycetota bacterium]|nr:glycine cleavage system aminomethyltransferase GcvT [Planctomycetota bacterium]